MLSSFTRLANTVMGAFVVYRSRDDVAVSLPPRIAPFFVENQIRLAVTDYACAEAVSHRHYLPTVGYLLLP